jgi:hypothetical protein
VIFNPSVLFLFIKDNGEGHNYEKEALHVNLTYNANSCVENSKTIVPVAISSTNAFSRCLFFNESVECTEVRFSDAYIQPFLHMLGTRQEKACSSDACLDTQRNARTSLRLLALPSASSVPHSRLCPFLPSLPLTL